MGKLNMTGGWWEGGGGQSPQVIFVFIFILGMLMYANEIETKEK